MKRALEEALGESRGPDNQDYSLEKYARDLDAVLEFAGNRRAVLVGHSIGGMIALTWCQLFPEKLAHRLAGLVLVNTTYQNPVDTTTGRRFFRAIQRPIIEPLLHVIAWVFPLVWIMNWVSYLNGTAHVVSMITGFAGAETRGQLDFATRFGPLGSPAVLARGVLAMFKFDARETPGMITVPTLIIAGHLDRLTVPAATKWIGRSIAISEVLELRPAGHVSTLEQNDDFGHAVSNFVERCNAGGTAWRATDSPALESRWDGAERSA